MTEAHPLGVFAPSLAALEKVDPQFLVAAMLRARERTVRIYGDIRDQLREGMIEPEARKLALEIFAQHGIHEHWHQPYVRFGRGTALSFRHPLVKEHRWQEGEAAYVDLGPIVPDEETALRYEGDYGESFVLGENASAERCIASARQLFEEAQALWREGTVTGEALYQFLQRRSREEGYTLGEDAQGHRLGDFPHHRYSKDRLADVPFVPSPSLWVLEVHLQTPDGSLGAFFEDLLSAS